MEKTTGTLDKTNEFNLLVNGVEHWNSNYNANI